MGGGGGDGEGPEVPAAVAAGVREGGMARMVDGEVGEAGADGGRRGRGGEGGGSSELLGKDGTRYRGRGWREGWGGGGGRFE